MTSIVINGNAYSDDGSTPQDMQHYGYLTHLLPMIGDTATVAGQVAIDAAQAALDAGTASNGALALRGTSTTSLAVSAGTKTLTTQTGKQFTAGNYVTISRTSAPTTLMHGVVTSYSGSTLTVEVATIAGSGTFTDWTIALSGAQGVQGPSGNGVMPYAAKTGSYTVVTTDRGSLIDCTSGTFTLAFQACATLGSDWSCYIRNSGTGVITLDPSGAETIDGAATVALQPNRTMIVQCDGATLRTALTVIKQTRMPIFSAASATATPVTNLEDIASGVSYSTGLATVLNVCYGDGLFVADGGSSASVATSPDGVTWTLRTMPSTKNWRVEHDGTNFLAHDVGSTNSTASSTDGVTWIAGTNLPGIAYSSQITIVGMSGVWLIKSDTGGTLYRSTDLGVTWSSQTTPASISSWLVKVSGYFFAFEVGGPTAYYSTTGLTGSWTSTTLPITPGEVWRSADGEIYFSVSGGSSQVYQLVNQTTFSLVSNVTLSIGYRPQKINGVWGAFASTFGAAWTLHSTGKVTRTSGIGMNMAKAASFGGVAVVPCNPVALTFNSTNSPTAIFEG